MTVPVSAPALPGTLLTCNEQQLLALFVTRTHAVLGAALDAIWLFGSAARGEFREHESDIDLLVITVKSREVV